jgi:bifunctional enzyme CysN/CysC
MVSVTAFISPYRDDRDRARRAAPESFHEIYVKADLATCEKRDPKGLYKKARDGKISDFTGIGSPYEPPQNPELVVDTQHNDVDECVRQIVDYIEQQMRLPEEKQAANKDKALVV